MLVPSLESRIQPKDFEAKRSSGSIPVVPDVLLLPVLGFLVGQHAADQEDWQDQSQLQLEAPHFPELSSTDRASEQFIVHSDT